MSDMTLVEELEQVRSLFISDERKFVGKTIAAVVKGYIGTLAIRFTDGTYTGITAEGGCCDEDTDIIVERPEMSDLRNLGVMSNDLYQRWWESEQAKKRDKRRMRWEELKEEFGKE